MHGRSIALTIFAASLAFGQNQPRKIEVASVRPAQVPEGIFRTYESMGNCVPPGLRIAGNRVEIIASSICALIRVAYNIQGYNVVGIPKALTEAVLPNYFEIQIQAEGDES